MSLSCNGLTLCHTSLCQTVCSFYGSTLCRYYLVGWPYVGSALCPVGLLSSRHFVSQPPTTHKSSKNDLFKMFSRIWLFWNSHKILMRTLLNILSEILRQNSEKKSLPEILRTFQRTFLRKFCEYATIIFLQQKSLFTKLECLYQTFTV